MSAVIDFKSSVFEKFSRFCLNPLNSDVVLVVGNDRMAAHRFVLTAHSDLIQDFLFSEGRNKSGEVILEANSGVLKVLLKFMYTGILNFEDLEFDDVLRLFELAHRFYLKDVELAVSEYLYTKIDAKTAVSVMEMVPLLDHEELQEKACFIVEMAIEGICQLERLPKVALLKVLDRSSRTVSEAKLLKEILNHVGSLTQKEKQMILPKVQFSKLTHEQLIDLSIPEEIIPMSVLVEKSKELSLHRAQKRVGKYSFGSEAMALTGDGKAWIVVNGKESTLKSKGNVIAVDLRALYICNHIKFQLQVMSSYRAHYCIEVSLDQQNWTRIRNFTFSQSFDVQNVYFPEIALRCIKVTGMAIIIRNKVSASQIFQMNALEISFLESPPKSIGELIYPEENVAVKMTAFANFSDSNGGFQYESKLLDHDQMTTYTAQVIKNGPLMIAFKQPYILDSCRFRLWDYDGWRCGYKVEVRSRTLYEVVADRSNELVDGWQTIAFTPRVVSLFRIWSTKCSHGNELRLVNFEAPANSTELVKS